MQPKGWLPLFIAALMASVPSAEAQRGSNWRVYKAADGLPETLATAISLGPRGHIWVRHPNVEWIGRLDGYDVAAIPAPNLGNSRIYEGASGEIWTSSGNEIFQYQDVRQGWSHYATPEISTELRKNNLGIFWPIELYPLKKKPCACPSAGQSG